MRLKKALKGFISLFLMFCMLISQAPLNVYGLEKEVIKQPLVFDDFEGNSQISNTNNCLTSLESLQGHGKVAKLEVESSDWPDEKNRSLKITRTAKDVSTYKYLTFWIKDTQGGNSARIYLRDENGNIAGGDWTNDAVLNKWTQLSLELSKFKNIDLTKITEIYIGEWNSGTYYIDDVQFGDQLAKDIVINPNQATGIYNDSFDLSFDVKAGVKLYYTIDGSDPVVGTNEYTKPITIDDTTTLKVVAVDNGYVSDVHEFVYTINHVDTINRTPKVVQTFEQDNVNVEAATDAKATIVNDVKHSGHQSLKYQKNKSEGASVNKGSIKIDFNHAVNVEGLKYFAFYIKDTQGSNTMQISLIDGHGKESSFGWRSPSTVKNKWVQYYVKVSDFTGIDKTQITGVRLGQWNSGDYYIDDIYFDNYLYTGLPTIQPDVPQSNYQSAYRFADKIEIELTNKSDAPMYYTLDGSQPNADSLLYTGKINLNDTKTLKVVSYDNGKYSDVVTYTYIKDERVCSDVQTNKVPGKYSKAMKVTLSSLNNEDIYYTLDGSNPTTSSHLYTEPIDVHQTTVIKAMTYSQGKTSNIMTFNYEFPSVPAQVTSSVEQTILSSATTIELISDLDATIYYTLDGQEPTKSSQQYTQPMTISASTVVKAIAVRNNLTSKISTIHYVIAPEAVQADKKAGTYVGSTIVEFRVPQTDKVEIYYTTDGSDPTIQSTHYSGPIKVTKDTTFKVAATYKGSDDLGKITTHQYTIQPVTTLLAPEITPSSGTYGQRQLVSMSCQTVDSKIYYTTDGSTPTSHSQAFTKDFYVTKDTVIKAISVKENQVSDVVTHNIQITEKTSPFLKTDGKVMRNNYGAGEIVQLKGTNIGGWLVMEEWQCPTSAPDQKTMLETFTKRFGEEKAWELINIYQDNWFDESDFKVLKDEGVNCLRLPITYFEMAYLDGTLKETAFERLDWFIEKASEYGIYVLIDMHGAFGSQNGKDHSGDITIPDKGDFFNKEENIVKTIHLWEAIAKRYKDNEWVAGYDLLNEPGGAVGTKQFEVYDRMYDAVRAIDQNHIIHIQAIWEPIHLPAPELYGWENVVYQYHFYGWDDINNLEYQKKFIDSKVDYVNQQTNYNVPVFVGEFTFFTNTDSWEYGLKTFDEQGWSYTSWTYKVAGDGSSWGMYTIPKNNATNVDVNNDSYDDIVKKWSKFDFKRNDSITDVLSKHFKETSQDTQAPVISGNNAIIDVVKDEVSTSKQTIIEIIDLFVKDFHDGVIHVDDSMITTDLNVNKVGEYHVKVEVSDKAGNQATQDFVIKVVENTTPDVPEEPVTPDTPQQPDNPNIDIDIDNGNHGSNVDNNESQQRPNTSDQTMFVSSLLLGGMALIGIYLLKRKELQ